MEGRILCLVSIASIFARFLDLSNMFVELLALYKEVQDQYETGRLEVPDDVTLLFADDNFGTIRRLPCGKEIEREGGAGVRLPDP